ncbi:MAG: cellulose biosynthesis protein BcsQ [Arcticibacterium sp.]|jgi:cellulose biosynthesis protein BcsQ
MPQIHLITSPSSGSGKTTTALNLALCFAALGRKSLIWDTTRASWLKSMLNIENKNGLVRISPFLSYCSTEKVDWIDFDNVLIDCAGDKVFEVAEELESPFGLLIPLEAEYYGMNDLPDFLKEVNTRGFDIDGFVPLMFREGSVSSEGLVAYLKQMFGNMVFEPSIQRNYYIARQKDYSSFSSKVLTEKAAVTYLNLANNLLEKNQ